MERKVRINWTDIVYEAKQRRLKQKFTQKRLAQLAGVTTPTLSRFENYKQDIRISSVIKILEVLGLTDERQLYLSDKEVIYLPDRMMVKFWCQAKDKEIECAIAKEALEDHYKGIDKDSIKVFQANRLNIEHEARRKYLADKLEEDGSILIHTIDL